MMSDSHIEINDNGMNVTITLESGIKINVHYSEQHMRDLQKKLTLAVGTIDRRRAKEAESEKDSSNDGD